MLAISPLSWLSDVAADGVPGRILEILRRLARGGSLYRDMSDMDTDEALRGLLRSHDGSVRVAQHLLVAAEAESDMKKLMLTMRDVQGILDPRAFAT